MGFEHKSVLLNETIEGLNIKPDGIYVDGTLGGGGHAYEVCRRLGEKGSIIGIDQDEAAIEAAGIRLKDFGEKVTIIRSNYCDMKSKLQEQGIDKVDVGLSFLKTRLPEELQPTKPFAVISESFLITTEITLNCKLAELKKQLSHHRDDLLILIHGGFSSTRYQKATNYDYLSDEAEKGSTSRSIYIVQAKELTPEIREHCIPIQLNSAEACSATTGVDSVTWGDLISLVEGNPNEFDSRVYRAYKEERDRMEGSSFCQEIAVLRAVSEIICWTFFQKASLSEEKVRDAYKTAFDHYPSRWDSMLNTTASDCFRNALYAAAREQTIRFRDIGDLDETYCKEKEVLYDEYKLYLTLDLVKRLVAKRMPEFLTSDVLAQLTEAGILSSSIVKTLTLSTGHSKNVRLRSINRSFVNGYGRRDITTIST